MSSYSSTSSSGSPVPPTPPSSPASPTAFFATQAIDTGVDDAAQAQTTDTKKTFVVECEDNTCPLVVHGVLLPNRATMQHSTAGDCGCEGSDRANVCTWMYWMAHMCLNHGLITEAEANAILDLTRKDLNLGNMRISFYGEEGMEKKEEEKIVHQSEESGEGQEALLEIEVNPAVLDADMFRAVQALTEEEWRTKIIAVEEILE